MSRAPTRSLVRSVAQVAAVVAVAYTVAASVRYGLIEGDDLAPACERASPPGWCDLRMLVIQAFLHDAFGLASVGCAAIALWRRSRAFALLAVAVGTGGMVLYNFTWAGVGVIAGAMVLARLEDPRQQDREPEGHAR
jgi:hypothetical protein